MNGNCFKSTTLALTLSVGVATDLTPPSAPNNKPQLCIKHELTLPDGALPVHVPEEFYEAATAGQNNYVYSGTGVFSRQQFKYSESGINALIVNCDEGSFAHGRRFD